MPLSTPSPRGRGWSYNSARSVQAVEEASRPCRGREWCTSGSTRKPTSLGRPLAPRPCTSLVDSTSSSTRSAALLGAHTRPSSHPRSPTSYSNRRSTSPDLADDHRRSFGLSRVEQRSLLWRPGTPSNDGRLRSLNQSPAPTNIRTTSTHGPSSSTALQSTSSNSRSNRPDFLGRHAAEWRGPIVGASSCSL